MDLHGEEKELFSGLEKLGINPLKAKQLIAKHGYKRVNDVIQHTKNQKYANNPAGYVIRAIEQNWTVWSKSAEKGSSCDGQAYITGPYADFVEH